MLAFVPAEAIDYQCPDCGKQMHLVLLVEQRCNCSPSKRYMSMYGANGTLRVVRS